MEITFDEVRRQVNELPLGYYAKRRLPMGISKEAPTSFYNPVEDEITISYPIIAEGLRNAQENESYKETAIRSMVYHELSHAILTPPDLFEYHTWRGGGLHDDILNVFEDERIETLLSDFYMDVNFKKNILYINGGTIKPPTNVYEAFYNLVRFRAFPDKKLLAEVTRIIEKYKDINCSSKSPVYYYALEIFDLYEKVEKLFKKSGASSCTPSAEELEQTANNINNSDNSENGYDKNENSGEKGQTANGKDGENGENGEQTECENESEENESGENSNEKGQPAHGMGGNIGNQITIFQKGLNSFRDTATTEKLKAIISTFNKKNNSGNGCTGYSGIFNPRNIKNNDYKFFDRKLEGKGNNKFGKLHLNLFIDESGSFYNLENAANTLIASLCEVERTNPNFEFDLICDSCGFRETPKEKRIVKADGGNLLSYKEVVEVMKKHTKKDAYVYNIVLHDGGVSSRGKNCFLGWDRNNVTLIDTGDNKYALSQLKNAKVVISRYDDLVKNLGNQVAKILSTAFR